MCNIISDIHYKGKFTENYDRFHENCDFRVSVIPEQNEWGGCLKNMKEILTS